MTISILSFFNGPITWLAQSLNKCHVSTTWTVMLLAGSNLQQRCFFNWILHICTLQVINLVKDCEQKKAHVKMSSWAFYSNPTIQWSSLFSTIGICSHIKRHYTSFSCSVFLEYSYYVGSLGTPFKKVDGANLKKSNKGQHIL